MKGNPGPAISRCDPHILQMAHGRPIGLSGNAHLAGSLRADLADNPLPPVEFRQPAVLASPPFLLMGGQECVRGLPQGSKPRIPQKVPLIAGKVPEVWEHARDGSTAKRGRASKSCG